MRVNVAAGRGPPARAVVGRGCGIEGPRGRAMAASRQRAASEPPASRVKMAVAAKGRRGGTARRRPEETRGIGAGERRGGASRRAGAPGEHHGHGRAGWWGGQARGRARRASWPRASRVVGRGCGMEDPRVNLSFARRVWAADAARASLAATRPAGYFREKGRRGSTVRRISGEFWAVGSTWGHLGAGPATTQPLGDFRVARDDDAPSAIGP